MKDIDRKQFVMIIVAWFLISYFLMWFFGGACTALFVTPAETSSMCIAQQGLSGLRNVPIIGLFIPYNEWVSLFYWFAPIAGFVFAFFGIKWWNSYFETKEASSIILPIVLIFVLLAGFYINLSWYYGEAAALNSNQNVQVGLYFCFDNDSSICNETVNKLNNEYIAQAQRTNATKVTQLILVNYWAELRESIFLTFIFGAIAAWVALFGFRFFDKSEEKKNLKNQLIIAILIIADILLAALLGVLVIPGGGLIIVFIYIYLTQTKK